MGFVSGLQGDGDEMDGGVDDAGAMLDDGNLSPRDITPISSVRWLIRGNIISKNTSYPCWWRDSY